MTTNFHNLYEELHARPPISIEAPKLVSVIAFITDESDNNNNNNEEIKIPNEEIKNLIDSINLHYNNKYGNNITLTYDKDDQYNHFNTQQLIKRITKNNQKEVLVVLQRHTSFFCITFIEDDDGKPPYRWGSIPLNIQNKSPIMDKAVFKTHFRIEKFDPNKRDQDYDLVDTFNYDNNNRNHGFNKSNVLTRLFSSMVSDGGAIVWTPFYSFRGDGFNRILVRDISLKPGRLGRLVRRLIEIDLYSTIALQNFGNAREQLKRLRDNEKKISSALENKFHNREKLKILRKKKLEKNLISKMLQLISKKNEQAINVTLNNKSRRSTDYQDCYDEISEIATTIANDIEKHRYNFQTTVAYSELVWQRVNELKEQRVEGWMRISYFLERRFRPGVRACEAALRSQIAISQEIQGVANLLETGLSLKLHEQECNFKKIVEFMALFPITYYFSSIIEKMFLKEPWYIISPIIWFLSFFLLFTPYGNKIAQGFLRVSKLVGENRER